MLNIEFRESELDFHAYEANYGVSYTDLQESKLGEFRAEINLLSQKSEKLVNDSALIYETSTSPLLINYPSAFLERQLNESEKIVINENETQEVAAVSVKMQEQLQTIPILESYERLVDLRVLFDKTELPAQFSEVPFHSACGEWAGKGRVFWTREHFAKRIAMMGKLLNGIHVGIRFEDAFRPQGVQEGLFQRRIDWTIEDHPTWSTDEIIEEARSKTAVTPRLASHKAGAAVDLRLFNIKNNKLLDIGHNYPDGGALVYLESPFLTQEQWRNRSLLRVAAYLCDIAMYVGEDWHVSHGDNLASLDQDLFPKSDYKAKYGPIKEFDLRTGEVLEVYNREELDEVFYFNTVHKQQRDV